MSTQAATAQDRITGFYDRVMYSDLADRFNGGTHFQNYGYWTPATNDYPTAAENLMGALLDLAPVTGQVLDVACGQGATTRYLGKVFGPANVTGINISEKQLETARELAPGSDLHLMDATDLDFADDSFDLVVCVEAAFHFETREDFLEEAYRVLRPGGYVVLSDILFGLPPGLVPYPGTEANRVQDPREYEDLLVACGFDDIAVTDATRACFEGFLDGARRFAQESWRDGTLPRPLIAHLLRRLKVRERITHCYVLAGARKPPVRPGRGR